MKNLYIISFNNYFNRKLKRIDNISDISEYVLTSVGGVNFNPNDHVNTEIKVNMADELADHANYVVVVEPATGEIDSCWFITESIRNCGGSWTMYLLRDVLNDNYDLIMNSPIYIEKGTPAPNSPLVFNRENMTYNQIKRGEWLLKDRTQVPWIVGYYSKKLADGSGNILSGTVKYGVNPTVINTGYASLDQWPYYQYTQAGGGNTFNITPDNWWIRVFIEYESGYYKSERITIYKSGNYTGEGSKYNENVGYIQPNNYWSSAPMKTAFDNANYTTWPVNDTSVGWHTQAELDELNNLNGKTIGFANGKYYTVTVSSAGIRNSSTKLLATEKLAANYIVPAINAGNMSWITGSPTNNTFVLGGDAATYKISLEPRTDLEVTFDISGGRATIDEVYNMFAIPAGPVTLNLGDASYTSADKDFALNLAREIQRSGGSNIYDVQLLPYCPCVDMINEDGSINLVAEGTYTPINDKNNTLITAILYPNKSTFEVLDLIPVKGNNTDIDWVNVPKGDGDLLNKKIVSECDELRLVSPNYNGQFSFNAAKNGGISGFSADCSYKPYTPYIHVNPTFSNLYGKDFNDARGLVCNGDFSLSALNDAWIQYEINNKNYNNIFNREISTMDNLHSVEIERLRWQVAVGTLTGAAAGAGGAGIATGGNIYAGMLGAAVGGAASYLGGKADINYTEKAYNYQRRLKEDLFGYSLNNVQALPYSLTKVGALNDNNKLFPFVEYYTCTPEEKQILENKIKYNGYTINAIGRVIDFTPRDQETFIKGRFIRFNDTLDYHMAKTIYDELESGIFITRDGTEEN